jgi:hypothetical protein
MPPKHVHSFRLSETSEKNLADFQTKHNITDSTEAVERILQRWKYLDGVDFQPFKDESIKCIKRIRIEGEPYCVTKPPNVKPLPSLEICVVCRKMHYGLTEKTMNETQQVPAEMPNKVSSPGESFERSSDPNNMNRKTAGQIYCRDGGFWVFPKKCDLCKTTTYSRWAECKEKPHDIQRASGS